MSGDVCGDNRFELIKKYKQRLIDGTNIETSPEEMEVLDTILFRFWQMGWLEDLELKKVELDTAYECGKNANDWIPVSEALPEENKTVIASTKYGVYPEARYSKEDGWQWAYESGADYWVDLEDVTAWMPLPKRYEPLEGRI